MSQGNYIATTVLNPTTAQLQAGLVFNTTATGANVWVQNSNTLITVPVLSGAATIVLPSPATLIGSVCNIKSVGTLGFACVISGTSSVLGGFLSNVTGAATAGLMVGTYTAGLANASVTLTAKSVAGDGVQITSDGTHYLVTGSSQAFQGVSMP